MESASCFRFGPVTTATVANDCARVALMTSVDVFISLSNRVRLDMGAHVCLLAPNAAACPAPADVYYS